MAGIGTSGLAEAYVQRKIFREKLDRQEAAAATAKHSDNDDAKMENRDTNCGKSNDNGAGGKSAGGGCFFRRFKTHSGSTSSASSGARVSDENMRR
ncbi:unnamed protein product [Linum trigynum]|uniref:Uncharacterized protein n=1 Tax=Linum trigynum TaxID=586398 RepID=A0AAV2EG68_9ROSI